MTNWPENVFGYLSRLCFALAFIAVACVRSGRLATTTPEPPLVGRAMSAVPPAPVVIELRPYVGRLLTARAALGADTLSLLFDTGGGETLLTPDVARRIGCSPAGRSVGIRMSGERVEFARCPAATLRLGELVVDHPAIGVFDVMALLPNGVPRLDGVLSLASFVGQTITLDLACRRLTVESTASAVERTRVMRPIVARVATGPSGSELTLFVRIESGPIPLWFEFDSGNLARVLLSPATASSLRVDAAASRDSASTARVVVSGLEPLVLEVAVRELIYDGALNEAFIASGEFTFDLRTGKGWAAVRSPPSQACPSQRFSSP